MFLMLWVLGQHAAGFEEPSREGPPRHTVSSNRLGVLHTSSFHRSGQNQEDRAVFPVVVLLSKIVDLLKKVHCVARSQVSGAYIGHQAKLVMNEKVMTWHQNKKQGFAPVFVNAESATTEQRECD